YDRNQLAEKLFAKIAFLLVTQNYIQYVLDKIEYINPINTHPSRVYLKQDLKSISIINNLDDVIEYLSRNDDETNGISKIFLRVLKAMGIADGVEIIQDERLPVRELRVRVKDLESNIKDVGYGVSLQLPIILKAVIADALGSVESKILMIEQPEVHLHPKLHAQLVGALAILSKHTLYFIETHSEHIIRKLQVIVKEKFNHFKSSDITIHYLIRVEKHTEVTTHKISDNGQLVPNLPGGFFDNSLTLAKQLL
ncbi:MAG: DUF3696 domain-containing protein, partial [Flavobacterium sp.]